MASERAGYDQALKRLFTQAHDGIFALLLPEARWLGARSPELTATVRQADLVWEVALAGDERVLLHVELQTDPDPEMGERLAEYAIRLWRRDHLPVRTVVIFLRPTGQRLVSPFVIERGGTAEALRFSFDVVRLWEEPADRVLALPEPGVWPLAALTADVTDNLVMSVADRIDHAPLPQGDRAELTGLLAVLSGLRLPRSTVEALLRRMVMTLNLFKDNTVIEYLRDTYRDVFAEEGRAEGRAEGLAEGLAEGRADGEAAGKRQLARSVLEGRFGALQPDELAALGDADSTALDALATRLATDSREQLRSRLGLA